MKRYLFTALSFAVAIAIGAAFPFPTIAQAQGMTPLSCGANATCKSSRFVATAGTLYGYQQRAAAKLCLNSDASCTAYLTANGGNLLVVSPGFVTFSAAAGVFTDVLVAGVDDDDQVTIRGATSGSPVSITASGADPDISIKLVPKGAGGVVLGSSGTAISNSIRCTTTVDLASAAAGACTADSTITCTGAATGAECIVGAPTSGGATGSQFTCYVSAADTVKLRHCCNAGASACDPPSATYSVRVFNS